MFAHRLFEKRRLGGDLTARYNHLTEGAVRRGSASSPSQPVTAWEEKASKRVPEELQFGHQEEIRHRKRD